MKFVIFSIFCVFSYASFAQTDTIIVNKDPRLDVLNQKQAVINKRSKLITSSGLYRGYRLQLLNTNNRNVAFKLKYDMLTAYPDQKTYVSYQAPYFKVRFGNYLHRDEAEKMRKQLQKSFPNGVFVVEDLIEYIPVNDDDVK